MRILFICEGGKWLGMAERVQEEGHTVIYHTLHQPSLVGEGIIYRTNFYLPLFQVDGIPHSHNIELLIKSTNPDLVVVDGLGLGRLAAQLRVDGKWVFGGGLISDTVAVPPIKLSCNEFGVWNGEKFIFKAVWDKFEEFIGIGSGILCDSAMVAKKINGKSELDKLLPIMQKVQYRGMVGVWNNQMYYSLPLAFFEIYKGNISSFLAGVAKMEEVKGRMLDDCFASLKISLPPYPFLNQLNSKECKDMQIKFPEEAMKHIWLNDCKKDITGLLCSGESGDIAQLTSRGISPFECFRRVYRTVKNLQLPYPQFRTDLLRVCQNLP